MKIIGLTGGIGAGKSTVSKYLEGKGYLIIDADILARDIVMPGMPALLEIEHIFGVQVIRADGTLDRKALGNIVFSDDKKRRELDAIMHLRIFEEINQRINKNKKEQITGIVIDAALLVETGLDKLSDEVWVVVASDDIRIQRVSIRDGIEGQKVLDRIRSQLSNEARNKSATYILDNSEGTEKLYQYIDKLIEHNV